MCVAMFACLYHATFQVPFQCFLGLFCTCNSPEGITRRGQSADCRVRVGRGKLGMCFVYKLRRSSRWSRDRCEGGGVCKRCV